jgi:hypothetical protein
MFTALLFVRCVLSRAARPAALAAVTEYADELFPWLQVVTSSAVFRACTFRSCESSANGGAIAFKVSGATLGLAGCDFARCRSSQYGGRSIAVRANRFRWPTRSP